MNDCRNIVVAPLNWSIGFPPNEKIHYDHVIADSALGIYSIEWKSWKKYDAYVLNLNGDFISTFNDIEEAKDYAYMHIRNIAIGIITGVKVDK